MPRVGQQPINPDPEIFMKRFILQNAPGLASQLALESGSVPRMGEIFGENAAAGVATHFPGNDSSRAVTKS
jgi:hypothetical protein